LKRILEAMLGKVLLFMAVNVINRIIIAFYHNLTSVELCLRNSLTNMKLLFTKALKVECKIIMDEKHYLLIEVLIE
jgi:hypothetical protein